MNRGHAASLAFLVALLLPLHALAQSGRVTFVTGDVAIQRKDGTRAPATRGAPINPGDQVVSGDGGLAQLDMADRARLSVRPQSQVEIVQYGDKPDSGTPATVRLLRGTVRSFTGALTPQDRDRFSMKTDVATVGVRGSGNILFAGRAADCDPERLAAEAAACAITVNHTIEGAHVVAFGDVATPQEFDRVPRLISGPGQTVLVTARGDVRFVPLPSYLAATAISPAGTAGAAADGEEARGFGPGDEAGADEPLGIGARRPAGDNGLGFKLTPTASDLVGQDPDGTEDVVTASGFTFAGQALPGDVRREGGALRGYRLHPGLNVDLEVNIAGGSSQEAATYVEPGLVLSAGRWDGAALSYAGLASGVGVGGGVHWITGGAGYPPYLAEVLTGTAVYTPVIQTSPTNQSNTAGSLTSARLDVNFSARTLDARLGVSMPAAGGSGGGSWQLSATGVPIIGGSFYASSGSGLLIANAAGARSDTDPRLAGSIEGRFVGAGLRGAILGYAFSDATAASAANHQRINGVVGFRGPAQDTTAPYRDALVSDPANRLAGSLARNFSFSARPGEIAVDASGRVSSFDGPVDASGIRGRYALGGASHAQSGTDAATGLVWGRWAGGTATQAGAALGLQSRSLHYIFSAEQSAPVALPLTGTATYEWVGGTSPTDAQGNVGTLTTASLSADFSRRTVDVGIGVAVGGQSVSATAIGVPIYRGQYFSAIQGPSPAGVPLNALLNITCTPTCARPTGSVDGFFTGRTGAGAGLMYNLNGITGAAAFRRPGG